MRKIIFIAVVLFSTSSFAVSKFSFDKVAVDRIGGHLGLVSPSDIDSTIGLGVEIPLGPVMDNVHIGTTVDYWSSSLSILNFSDFILGINARYLFKGIAPKFTPYAGGGFDLHFYSFDLPIVTVLDTSSTEFGINFFGGTLYEFKKNLDFFSEARYRTNVSQLHLKFGAIYRFK